MTNLEWAMEYRNAGMSVFPCKNKRPLVASWRGYGDALPSQDEIADWWLTWPDAQIAVACGKVSGITVIDIDKGVRDTETVMWELWNKGVLTMTSVTGGGGRHLFCRYADVQNSVKVVDEQIDIKSTGGYIILPPSAHESGSAYAWHYLSPWSEYNFRNLAPFPAFLAPAGNKKPGTDWQRILSGVGQGSRNVTMASVAGWLAKYARGGEHDMAWELLRSFNLTHVQPPLDEKELWSVFNSIVKRDLTSQTYGGTRKD